MLLYAVNFTWCNNVLSLGQPTTKEKAKLFIKSLDLGHNGNKPILLPPLVPSGPVGPQVVPNGGPIVPLNISVLLNVTSRFSKRALLDSCPLNVQKICSATQSKKFVWLDKSYRYVQTPYDTINYRWPCSGISDTSHLPSHIQSVTKKLFS